MIMMMMMMMMMMMTHKASKHVGVFSETSVKYFVHLLVMYCYYLQNARYH